MSKSIKSVFLFCFGAFVGYEVAKVHLEKAHDETIRLINSVYIVMESYE